MILLNRILRVSKGGLLYEPDHRHAELIIQALEPEHANRQVTPGVTVPVKAEGVTFEPEGPTRECHRVHLAAVRQEA